MKYVVGNWKMNPQSVHDAIELARAVDVEGAIICPPFVYLEEVSKNIKKAKLGAQDCYVEDAGAFTGEISLAQLKDLSVRYVIVGHSERRALGEDNALVSQKLRAVLAAGLVPILCVGESAQERDEGKTQAVVKEQIETALFQVDKESALLIAYEPVWAIGSGKPASPEQAQEVAQYIKTLLVGKDLDVKILYGGSTNAQNIQGFLDQKNIDGVLPGGASLKPEEFKKMVEISKK